MASSGLKGSYRLTKAQVDAVVTKKSAGAYALGERTETGKFWIRYVGRSDKDLNDRLKDHIGDYRRFKFEYYGSAKAAFEKECHLYHDFSPQDNKIHPDRPDGSNWKCPVCDKFD